MGEEIELLDSQNETETVAVETDEVVTEESDDTEKLKQTNAKLYARLKKEQETRKALEERLKVSSPVQSPSISREEVILIAKGYSEQELEVAQGIAKGFGIPLSEAVSHEMFVTYKEKKDRETKSDKAKLGASNSSGSRRDDKVKPDMSAEDHKEAWRKALS